MLSARSNASNANQIKLTFKGDTKKVKLSGDYEELLQRTRASFDDLPEGTLKFFYVDEESDLISVTSQADLTEALESTNLVKLTVAESNEQALNQIVGGDAKAQIFDSVDDATSELVVEEPAVSEDFVQIDSNEEEVKVAQPATIEKSASEEDSSTISLLKKEVDRADYAWRLVETAKKKEDRARSIISDLRAEIAHLNQIVGGDAKAQIFDKIDDATNE